MKEFEKRYQKLNEDQKKAVDAIEGPVLVLAGPGSGKTEILGLRVVNILKKADVYPSNILCLTFTDSASVNMRDRLKQLIGPEAYNVAIHTFHSLGRNIRNHHPEIFYRRDIFTSADELTQLNIIESILEKLSYDNPLAKTHPEWGYVYSSSIKNSIENLKKAGLTPKEFSEILEHNESSLKFLNELIDQAFGSRVSKDLFERLPPLIEEMKRSEEDFPVEHMQPLVPVVAGSLERALKRAINQDKTSPLTEWKNEWTFKTEQGTRKMKESKYLDKMKALAEIYKRYSEEMERRGYYDFDDMILDVIKAIEENDELRYELQEQYRYILVDEFQDTNDAQMRFLHLLTGAEVQEGRPNLMVVGDDDQAIFKFQGAEISNILEFQERYRDPRVITLTKNYRSRQNILDVARYIINQGDQRLENIISQVDKTLKSEEEIGEGQIVSKSFPSKPHQYYWIAREIKNLIDEGVQPNQISIIGREHKHLKNLVPHLAHFGIPISYEKQRDVLKEPHIQQLIIMARFVNSIMDPEQGEADHLLSKILSFPFWGLDRKVIWELSRRAYREGKSWLECMQEHEQLQQIADFFLELATMAQHQPLERVLDKMVGAKMQVVPDSEEEDPSSFPQKTEQQSEQNFVSPFKDYYFASEKFEQDPVEYLTFLSSLRTFIYALREYRRGESIGLKDLLDFVDIHRSNDMTLPDQSTFASARDAVHLLTAHKAKGSEFDTVFVVNCQEKVWAGSKRGSKLPFPGNLPIAPAGDNRDDQLRLFYVAVSRAARNLYLTSYELEGGREENRLQFITPPEKSTDLETDLEQILSPDQPSEEMKTAEVETGIIHSSWESYHHPPFQGDEEVLLETVLEDYKLSVTHFNNFLNVKRGGPQTFLEENLLRFPQPKTPALSFGIAMHQTMAQIYKHLKRREEMPSRKQVLNWFEKLLFNERLSPQEFENYLQRGKDALKSFYQKRKDRFKKSHYSEFNFSDEGVAVNDISLTGKIDKIVCEEDRAVVWDFKTGKALKQWDKGRDYHKVKSWKYRNQLIFYKLLIENSRRFNDYEVKRGIIEFLEPEDDQIVDLELEIEEQDVKRVTKLIESVYNRIMNLDFPDVEDYSQNIKGIKNFEQDLLEDNL